MHASWLNFFFIVLTFGERGRTSCENGLITQLFGKEKTLIYVLNDSYYHTNNPKYIFGNYKTLPESRIGNISDYIIQVQDEFDLIKKLKILQKTWLWDAKKSPKRRFLIFVNNNITTPQRIFDYAKKKYMINVLIVNFLFAETFAAYYPKTYCNGIKFTSKIFTCNKLDKINFEGSAKILHGCQLDIFVVTALPEAYVDYIKEKDKGFLIRPLFFLQQMYQWKMKFTTSNVPFQFQIHENKVKDINGSDVFACDIRLNISDDYRETTKTILYENFLWLLPVPKKKSNVKVLMTIYSYVTWTFIIAALCFVASVNFVIDIFINQRRDFQRSFLEIFRLTLGSGINQLTKLNFYRIFLISYIIYCLHVNCFYQGKLSAVLTSANYERHIRNVEDLYESNLRLLVPSFTRTRWKDSGYTLAKKFADKADVYVNNLEPDADLVLKEGNTALLTKSFKPIAKELELVDYFPDTLRLTTEYAYALLNGSYYIPFFDNMIRVTNENGFLSKWTNDIRKRNKLPKLNRNATLTMKHLTGAFIILFVGLVIGLALFIGEIMAFKMKINVTNGY